MESEAKFCMWNTTNMHLQPIHLLELNGYVLHLKLILACVAGVVV